MARDQPQPGSLFSRERDPGNEVAARDACRSDDVSQGVFNNFQDICQKNRVNKSPGGGGGGGGGWGGTPI